MTLNRAAWLRARTALAKNLAAPRPVVLMLFTLQLAAMIAVIPPWQNPDEPQHVMFASVMAKHGPGMLPNAFDDDIEADIVQSMVRHRWWRLYERAAPNPVPPTFKGIEGVEMSTIHGPPMYYVALGALLKRLPVDDATTRLYILRSLSALLALAALWCIWSGTELFVGRAPALVVSSFVALHPQFAIVSTTAGPDACANLAGAVVWLQLARLWTGRDWAVSLALMWISAVAAAATARLAAPLLAIAGAITLWVTLGRLRPLPDRRVVLPILAVVVGAMALVAALPSVMTVVERIVNYAAMPLRQAFTARTELVDLWRWLDVLHASFWLTAGWMRYRPPEPMVLAVIAAELLAVGGLVRVWTRDRSMRERIALALLFPVVQLAAVVVTFYFNTVGGQGRYLFPAFAPTMALFWIGLHGAAPARLRPSLGPLAIVVAFCANLAGWYTVLFPTFLRTA